VALLKSRLAEPPFRIKIAEPEDKTSQLGAGKPFANASSLSTWLNRVAGTLSRKGPQPDHGPADCFVIEGVMR
jgi:hypothetical protein